MSVIELLSVFLRRIAHCRGFGVQSPTDFAFVNEVIYERSPYYAYEPLRQQFAEADWFDVKLARLIFRVCNYVQPKVAHLPAETSELIEAHIHAACPHAEIKRCDAECIRFEGKIDAFVVLELNGEGNALWQELVGERAQKHLILYDLHYLGIALVLPERYPEHYIINFY